MSSYRAMRRRMAVESGYVLPRIVRFWWRLNRGRARAGDAVRMTRAWA